jgi:2-C-methyl-D-erythritol 2,4-cyclodiphosphate synthase
VNYRIGYGEDAHALAEERPLIIGGIHIANSSVGAVAHSDGDVLLHALSDALLSAFALGDIGTYFPPSNPAFKDMNSALILEHSLNLIQQKTPCELVNLAAVITLDAVKLGPYRSDLQAQLARLLNLPQDRIGITFKTSEGLATKHVQARVTVLLNLRGAYAP